MAAAQLVGEILEHGEVGSADEWTARCASRRLLGLIDPTSAFWGAMQEARAFVVHVLAVADRALAERFSEGRPPIRGPFDGLVVAGSPWGPVLAGIRPRVACRLVGSTPVDHGELIDGVIEEVELLDLEDPLACLHGSYRSVRGPPGSRLRTSPPAAYGCRSARRCLASASMIRPRAAAACSRSVWARPA